MKRILIIAFLFIYSYSNSQTNGIIEVNPNKKVYLFFKSKIVKGESLPNRTLFEFDKEKGSSIGTVTGEKNGDSNLLVTTADGLTYSFSLKYTKRVGTLNYFIEKKEATNYTKDMEVAANSNKEMTIDKSGLIVMKGATTKPKVETEVADSVEKEALAAARLEKEKLEQQIKEEAAALKKAEKEKASAERAAIAEKRKAERTIKKIERKKEKALRDAVRKKEKELRNIARKKEKALKEAARKKEQELKETERKEIAAHKEELALKEAAQEKEAALKKIAKEKEEALKKTERENKKALEAAAQKEKEEAKEAAHKEEIARKEAKAIEDAAYKEELAIKETARKEEEAIGKSIKKEALALNETTQKEKTALEKAARKKEKALKKSERKKKRAMKNSERNKERKMREELEKNRKANKAAKKKRGNVAKVADEKEEIIVKDQDKVQKQIAIPKAATDVTGGLADGGFGLNLSYNKMLKKGYLKYGLNGAFSKMKSSLTKQDVPLSVYTFDLGYFIPLVHKTKVNFAIGGGGLLGYETIKKGDIEITAKNNFVYGAYIGTEFAYRFTDKVGLLLKYNQNFYLNSDIGNTAPYMGIGLRFYTNKKKN